MKKTLLTLAALAGVVTANESVTWTVDTPTPVPTSSTYSAWYGVYFTLDDSSTSYTVASSPDGADFDLVHTLQSITLKYTSVLSGNTYVAAPNGVKGILIDSASNTILGSVVSTATTETGKPLTFDFSSQNISLNPESTYTLAFTAYNNSKAFNVGDTASTTKGDYIKLRVWATSAPDNNDGYVGYDDVVTNSTNSAYIPGMTIVTSTLPVPEPATATLGLMALAGLAVRRRRK